MEYIVQRPHVFRGERGEPLPKIPGDLVQVASKRIAKKLVEQGIVKINNLPERNVSCLERASRYVRTFRVGCFLHNSKFYSGGRVHIFQVLWTLADMGAEVYLITDNLPRWLNDYPSQKRLYIVNSSDRRPPDDLDLIFTDGKGAGGEIATAYKLDHPNLPYICLNFETPNWVEKYVPETAGKMPEMKAYYKHANLLLANSSESLKWLKEYMTVKVPTGVLPPAANTFAMDKPFDNPIPDKHRGVPYVVWSARGSAYKGAQVITEAILSYPKPLNLVLIGQPSSLPGNTEAHAFIHFSSPITDAQKMGLMKGAVCVAAPSLFEGYGMVPGEALGCGRPVVVYDLPVLRQNYGDRLVYAKWNNRGDFTKKLHATIDNPPAVDSAEARKTFGMDAMKKHVTSVPFFNFKARRVSAQMIVYYGATVQEAIASVYPHVDEVLIAYGPTEMWKEVPPDNSLELIQSFPDPDKKIRLIQKKAWANKQEMRQACQRIMTGNYLLIVDADEIYDHLDKWIREAPDYGCPRWVHFWHNIDYYVVDTPGMERWGHPHPLGGGAHNHLRWAYWRYSYEWCSVRGTVAWDKARSRLCSAHHTKLAVEKVPETCIYHLGHVLPPDLMTAKHQYYLQRDGTDDGRIKRMKAWHGWDGKTGDCGDGVVMRVNWPLPELVKQAYAKVETAKCLSK